MVEVFQPTILTQVNAIIRQHFPELLDGDAEQPDVPAAPALDTSPAVVASADASAASSSVSAATDEKEMDTTNHAVKPATGRIVDA